MFLKAKTKTAVCNCCLKTIRDTLTSSGNFSRHSNSCKESGRNDVMKKFNELKDVNRSKDTSTY